MTDAHCHLVRGPGRHFVASPFEGELGERDVVFFGTHPWFSETYDPERLCTQLTQNPCAGVGEIGLDRLRDRTISPRMREIFVSQLEIAAAFSRPVVLHGAKCWGEVVAAVKPFAGRVPAFLFHGFSRSDGLLPDIVALNGFISVGPAVLNDHAVNYRALVGKIPLDRLLAETDLVREEEKTKPDIAEIIRKVAEIRKIGETELIERLDRNADAFARNAACLHPADSGLPQHEILTKEHEREGLKS